MTIDVETYLQQLAKGKNKLDTWETEIFQLFHAKASYQDIVNYLSQNNVATTKAEIHRFIHRKKRRHLLTINPAGEVQSENPGTGDQSTQTGMDGARLKEHGNPGREGAGLPKFNWRQSRDKDKPEW